jgi:hypothetical protein
VASCDEAGVGLIGRSKRGGRRKRRSFRWPEEATQLVREYLRSPKPGQFRSRNSVAGLATRLAALSGNPRDACFRFLHQQGVTQRRTWRPWTKPEQQRLFDLIETCPVEEVSKIMQRSPRSIRSMLHRLGEAPKEGEIGSHHTASLKLCTSELTRCKSGSIRVGSSAGLLKQPMSKSESSILMISLTSLSSTAALW